MRGIRLGAASIVISLAASMSGCWMMAASLAPLGLQVVEATAIRTGEGISGKTPTDEFEGGVDCESLGRGLPYVAEVRTRPDGGVDMRQLALSTTTGSTRWQVVNDATGSDPQGWRTELAIGQLTFDPPLTEAIKSSQGKYLVSAPTEPTSEPEMKRSLAFVSVFAPRYGIYQWKNKRYEYTVTRRLPCFPLDS